MQVNDFVKVTVGWDVLGASEPVLNVWDFECVQFDDPTELQIVGPFIAAAFVAKYVTPMLVYMSNQVACTSLSIRSYADETEGYDTIGAFGTGASTSTLLPPFVTYSLRGQRFNFNIRNARKGLPGPNVNALGSNGQLTSSYVSGINATVEDWHDQLFVEAGENIISLMPRIVRDPSTKNTNPTVWSPITKWTVNPKFGSQNSRK